jgi:uncharacterized membrane protein YgcG
LRIGRSGLTRGDREWPLNEETHTRPCLTCCPRLQCERDWGCVSSSATRIASSVAARRWRVSLHRHLPLSPLTSHLSPLSLLPHGVPSLHGGGVSLFIVTSLSHLSPLTSLSPPPRSSVAARRWRVSLHRHLPLSPLTSRLSLSSPTEFRRCTAVACLSSSSPPSLTSHLSLFSPAAGGAGRSAAGAAGRQQAGGAGGRGGGEGAGGVHSSGTCAGGGGAASAATAAAAAGPPRHPRACPPSQ